ncbi:MAG: hypothetical protein Q8Q01_04005 [archaeon]|nr:hypothetical protein [archaeon]
MDNLYKALVVAAGFAALTGCDHPERRILYETPLLGEVDHCSVEFEQRVMKAQRDKCRLEVKCATGVLLTEENFCDSFDNLRIYGKRGETYLLEVKHFGDNYFIESKVFKVE